MVRKVTDYEEFTGHIVATSTIQVRARVSGYLAKVLYKEGSEVKKATRRSSRSDPLDYQAVKERADAGYWPKRRPTYNVLRPISIEQSRSSNRARSVQADCTYQAAGDRAARPGLRSLCRRRRFQIGPK